ncbi:MAG: T9SS type A sorting domain-containing protein [Limnohabitans sp.]|nr:T9SS type A sorting domain-containing protein [Limnohabitans sp.]
MKKTTLIVIFLFLKAFNNFAQQNNTIVTYPSSFSVSKPLSDFFVDETKISKGAPTETKIMGDKEHRKAMNYKFKASNGVRYQNDESTVQRSQGLRSLTPTLQNWAGLDSDTQQYNMCPLDPSGAAGTNHYIQCVNSTPFKIFDKSNGSTVGTVQQLGNLWSPVTGNEGDPIVMYDRYADRWFIAQFGTSADKKVYIAISQTSNPAGQYYTYTFVMPKFTDYLKFSIWADGYYMSSNGTNFINVFERDKMLSGDPTARALTSAAIDTQVYFDTGFWCPLTGDADGSLPPAGTPCPLVYFTDNGWGTAYQDAVRIHNLTTNWSATPSLTIASPVTVPVASFDSSYASNWNDVEQGVGTQRIDAIGGAVLYRAQWRKWTGYNTMLMCWSVKMSDGVYSTKWVEMRQNQSNNTWSLYQEGIYAPDNLSRWIGSIAMDDNGSIGMSYLCTGKTPVVTSPSMRYTGRLKTDPLGQMTFAEQTAVAGSGATNCSNRVGDYSHMSLDPDGLTFWNTGHYFNSGSRTRVYSFRITPPLGTENFEDKAIFNVYQNNENLIIDIRKINTDNEVSIDLFDITGKQLVGKKIRPENGNINTSFSTSSFASGVYMVRIGNNDFQKVIKTLLK